MCPSFGRDPHTEKVLIDWHTDSQISFSIHPILAILPPIFTSNYHKTDQQQTQTQYCVGVCSSQLVCGPGCCEYEWSSSLQLSIYQHAGCPASWCLLGWSGRLGKSGSHRGGRWGPPSGTVMPTGTDGAASEQHDGEGTGHVWRRGEGGILSHVCANPDKLDKASSE